MPDFHTFEDEATLYVLGELTAAERRNFEARLAQSRELRALVRELEEGVVVLSTGLPHCRPPSGIWAGIEKAVGRQRQPDATAWWRSCWRNGWAAAALCLLGWSLHVILLNNHPSARTKTTGPAPAHETIVANASPATEHPVSLPPAPTNTERLLLQVRAEEISDLRLRINAMAQETNDLSHLLAQERTRLAETNRIKFYQFTTASASNGDAAAPPLSPAMQRAVLISVGRELGWLPMATQSHLRNGHVVNTVNGIDFVDLRPTTGVVDNQPANQSTAPPNQPSRQPDSQLLSQPQAESQVADVTPPSIPAFVSGDKHIVGVDSSIALPNSSVTLTVSDGSSQVITFASLSIGENPTMITLPYHTTLTSDGNLVISAYSFTASGMSNFTQVFGPANP
jgi:hypothetical protein